MRRSVARLAASALLLAACSTPPAASPADSGTDEPTPSASPPASASPTQAASASASSEPPALAWTQLDAPGPAAREDHTWTVDPASGVAYLFGGRDGATAFGDTWAYDLAADAWTELALSASPPARFGHEAVWVPDVGLVVFAGQAGATFFGDLWAFDPDAATWTELPAGGSPPTPRYGSCAALGPDGRLWISHGFTQDLTRFADTRAYDFGGGAWADETPSGEVPVVRCLHGCWWTDNGELALYAGQTTDITSLGDRWLLADGAWTPVQGQLPAERNLYARTRIDGATLVFGGQGLDSGYLDDLWMLADGSADARGLEPASEGEGPAGRAGGELVLDAKRQRALLFGGRTADGVLDDLWSLDGLEGLEGA
jgi:galactose oxidase-like protein